MNYYSINFTLDSKIRGSNNYIKDYKLKIPNSKLYWEEPLFVGNIFDVKINFEPYLLDVVLFPQSNLLDLIMDGGPISGKLIISDKLKKILQTSRNSGLQFFKINVIHKANTYNYWLLNMYESNQEFIDFEASKVSVRIKKSGGGTNIVNIKVSSLIDFIDVVNIHKEKMEIVSLDKIYIKKEVKEDFFLLKYPNKYVISETLREKIEQENCTGLEFQPLNLSYDEWTSSGGEREKIYGKII